MRVFSVFFHPSSRFTAVGGAEKRFIEVSKVWVKREDLELTVFESYPSLFRRLGLDSSSRCKVFCSRSFFSGSGRLLSLYLEWIFWVFKACLRCLKLVLQESYDVILAVNNTLPNVAVAFFIHLFSRRPLCVVVHHLDFPYSPRKVEFLHVYRLYRKASYSRFLAFVKTSAFFLILFVLRRSDRCVTVSNFTAELLRKNGVPSSVVHVSGNGVNVGYIENFKVSAKVYDGVFVGRVARDKGVFDLVKVWSKIVSRQPNSRLLIIGNGPDISELRRLVETMGLANNVIVRGACGDGEMYRLLNSGKIFVFPSLFEGWGLAVAEALASGLPVICYNIPALREVFGDCPSVFLIKVGDVESFSEKVLELLNFKNLGELGKFSEDYSKRFSWEKVALRDLEILRSFFIELENPVCFKSNLSELKVY